MTTKTSGDKNFAPVKLLESDDDGRYFLW